MALRRTLEMLKAGERVNDMLYRSTLEGSRRRLARRWAYGQATRSVNAISRWKDAPRAYRALDPSGG